MLDCEGGCESAFTFMCRGSGCMLNYIVFVAVFCCFL